jgi:hypothetical protein
MRHLFRLMQQTSPPNALVTERSRSAIPKGTLQNPKTSLESLSAVLDLVVF